MDKKLIKAIEEHLPALQMDTLKANLSELDKLREKSASDDNTIKQLRELNSKTFDNNQRLEQKIIKVESERDLAIKDRKEAEAETRTHKINALENDVRVAQAELAGVKDTVSAFLKNTIIRENRQHGITVENPGMAWNQATQRMEPTGYMNKNVIPTEDVTTKEAE